MNANKGKQASKNPAKPPHDEPWVNFMDALYRQNYELAGSFVRDNPLFLRGRDPDGPGGRTAASTLSFFNRAGSSGVFGWLWAQGARPEPPPTEGQFDNRTPLVHEAAMRDAIDNLSLIVAWEDTRGGDALRQHTRAGTPMHVAAVSGSTHAMHWMLEFDPGIFDVLDAQSRTPLALAREKRSDLDLNHAELDRSIILLSAWGARQAAQSALDEALLPGSSP